MFWIRLIAMLAALWQPADSQSREEAVAPPGERPPLQCAVLTRLPAVAPLYSLRPAVADAIVAPAWSMGRCGTQVLVSGEVPVAVAGASGASTIAVAPMTSSNDDDGDDEDEFDKGTGPWIGVQLAPVPKVLASHLKLDGERLMILNIAKDSPADEADLEQYDVIVELNGEPAGAEAGEFASRIRKLEVDKPAKLTVVREGNRKTIKITPTKRPKLRDITYKYKVEDDVVEDTQESRGAMFRRGRDGQWQMLPMPPTPPAAPAAPGAPAAPAPPPIRFDIIGRGMPEGNSTFVIVESKDGVSTEIRRDADGTITVSRSAADASAPKKVRKFKSAEDLKDGDPAAWEMYRRLRGDQGRAFAWGGNPGWGGMVPRMNDPNLQRDMERARAELERAMKQLNNLNNFNQPGPGWQMRRGGGDARPDTRFEQLEDGRIRVTTRDGDQELVQVYKSADDLKDKRPGLYDKFRRLSGASESDD